MPAQILIADDQVSIQRYLRAALEREGHAVETVGSGAEALERIADNPPDLLLVDERLPDRPGLEILTAARQEFPHLCILYMTRDGEAEAASRALRAGAFEAVAKPFKLERLLLAVERGLAETRAARELFALRRRTRGLAATPGMVISEAPAMQEIYATVRKIAAGSRASVLLEGESGVGKDVIANLIHATSDRSDRAFLDINCAALPEKLLESELFGHEKGAFTDAVVQKPGLLEMAHQGTLFLDEIGEMGLALQVKLLRVLERQVFRRVGGVRDISVDVRIISATNRDLDAMVAAGTFREDLYYRLKVVPLRIPALRERPGDVLHLAAHFLQESNRTSPRRYAGFTEDAEAALLAHAWPGNIRELRNVIERAVLLGTGERLGVADLGLAARPGGPGEGADLSGWEDLANLLSGRLEDPGIDLPGLLQALESRAIEQALELTGGNRTRAAALLGMHRDQLRYRLRNHDKKTG